jgi:hypothetical protein
VERAMTPNLLNLTAANWANLLLVGSIALLICCVLLKFRVAHKDANARAPQAEHNTIGQYRPQVYR